MLTRSSVITTTSFSRLFSVWHHKLTLLLGCWLLTALAATQALATGTWHNHLAYSNITSIKKGGNTIYVLASGGLYAYNTADNSVTTYAKATGLSDNGISFIDWCQPAKRLVIVYSNGNIDLIDAADNVYNMPDYYNKILTSDKTIYGIDVINQFAYLSTGFGVVKLNVQKNVITDTYTLGFKVNHVYQKDGKLHASSADKGDYAADLGDNLTDPAVWKRTGGYVARNEQMDTNLLNTVKTVNPGGPATNDFYFLTVQNGKLYTTNGMFVSGYKDKVWRNGELQILNADGSWDIAQARLDTITHYSYVNNNCVAVDPSDANHVFVGGQTGLYEFKNNRLLKYYNRDNSPLQGALSGGKELGNDYVLVNGMTFDSKGSLWILNSQAPSNTILELTKSGEFVKHDIANLMYNGSSFNTMAHPFFDSRGLMWFVNISGNNPAIVCYQPSTEQVNVYQRSNSSFVNEDGTPLSFDYFHDIAEDKDGNIWVGTEIGPMYLSPNDFQSTSPTILTQPKIPRNDGTNYADYMLDNTPITAVAIDGEGRKWLGTDDNGVYLRSADNMTQVAHFTTGNSPLLSDYINHIAVNGTTGEVYFATEQGLCSYMSDATTPNEEMTKDNVYAYPNPVKPGYTGPITITGLSYNADVKITTSNGVLVTQGTSNGGSFVWDGNDTKGRRVASGIYMVMAAKEDGSKGTVCKIAIIN